MHVSTHDAGNHIFYDYQPERRDQAIRITMHCLKCLESHDLLIEQCAGQEPGSLLHSEIYGLCQKCHSSLENGVVETFSFLQSLFDKYRNETRPEEGVPLYVIEHAERHNTYNRMVSSLVVNLKDCCDKPKMSHIAFLQNFSLQEVTGKTRKLANKYYDLLCMFYIKSIDVGRDSVAIHGAAYALASASINEKYKDIRKIPFDALAQKAYDDFRSKYKRPKSIMNQYKRKNFLFCQAVVINGHHIEGFFQVRTSSIPVKANEYAFQANNLDNCPWVKSLQDKCVAFVFKNNDNVYQDYNK